MRERNVICWRNCSSRAALPKVAENKHKYIAHDLLVCACGLEYTQVSSRTHTRTHANCLSCPISISVFLSVSTPPSSEDGLL